MISMIRLAACLILIVTLGCDGRGPTSGSLSLSGQWQGTIVSAEDGAGTMTMVLTQTGREIDGSVLLSQSGLADVPGTVTGTLDAVRGRAQLRFTVTYEFGFHCQGAFGGVVDVNSTQIDGTYSGMNCVHSFSGTLHETKSD